MLSLKPAIDGSLGMRSRPMVVAIDIDPEIEALGIQDLFSLVDFKGDFPILRTATGLFSLDDAPTLLAAVLVGDARSERTKRFLTWLDDRGTEAPPVLLCETGGGPAVLRQLAERLAAMALAGGNRRAATLREAARLQSINSDLQYQFQVAEQALHRRGAAQKHLAFLNEPAFGNAHRIVLTEADGAMAQILPVASGGVGAIGIHVATAGDTDTGELDARLLSLEDGRVLAQWLVPARDLHSGWNLLGLARAPSGPDRTLELHLECSGAEGRLPALSLGLPQPIPTFRLRCVAAGTAAMTNSLALQIWQCIPGAIPPRDRGVHLPLQPGVVRGGFVDMRLGATALAQIEHSNADEVHFDFPAVIAPPGEGIVLCHPPSSGVTMGCLARAAPATAMRISASAFIGHEKSRDIDFGIVVSDTAERARDISLGRIAPDRHEGFSGWCKVGQGEVRRLSAFREPGDGGAQSIFIATRMSQPGDNSHAWARFRDFSLMVQA